MGGQNFCFARLVFLGTQCAKLKKAKVFAHFIAQELRSLLRAFEPGGVDIPGQNRENRFGTACAAEIAGHADQRSVSVDAAKLNRLRGPPKRHIKGGNTDGYGDNPADHAREISRQQGCVQCARPERSETGGNQQPEPGEAAHADRRRFCKSQIELIFQRFLSRPRRADAQIVSFQDRQRRKAAVWTAGQAVAVDSIAVRLWYRRKPDIRLAAQNNVVDVSARRDKLEMPGRFRMCLQMTRLP